MLKHIFILFSLFLLSAHLFSQHTLVFFGSFNEDKTTEGISVYELDTLNGNLTKMSSVKGILNPSYLTLSPHGDYLFACTESNTKDAGSVSSFKINSRKGELTFINSQQSGGENPVYVSVHRNGKWLINANYTGSSVSVYPILEDGRILPHTQNFHYKEGSIDTLRQAHSHIHSSVFSPDCEYVFTPDLGSDKIRAYRFRKDQEKPLQEAEKPFTRTTLGSGPRHLAFHPNEKFAYCTEEMGGAIGVYTYKEGRLKPIQRIYTHPEELKGGFGVSDIHVSPDGRFLYAANRGTENNIAIFSIQSDGTLRIVGYQSTLGNHPRSFALDESGKFLIVTNLKTGDAFVFARNAETGLLKRVGGKVEMRNVSSVQIRKYP